VWAALICAVLLSRQRRDGTCFSGIANAKQFGAVQKEWFTQRTLRNSQNTQIADYCLIKLCAFCATC
jgi:hypothetical protein